MPDGFRALLIGNSRWHWAEQRCDGWSFDHTPPDSLRLQQRPPHLWAAVGAVPPDATLQGLRQVQLRDVPLREAPPWLGVDRALAGWRAWQQLRDVGRGVLVVDAGTVLSLTRVTPAGEFAGGQLAAGMALQLRAMAAGAEALPLPAEPLRTEEHSLAFESQSLFPRETPAAMRCGVRQALLGLIVEAQRISESPLWLCGGDAPELLPRLLARGVPVHHAPNLVLEGLLQLRNEHDLRPIRPD